MIKTMRLLWLLGYSIQVISMACQLSLWLNEQSVNRWSFIIIIFRGLWHLFEIIRIYPSGLLPLKSRAERQDSLFNGGCQLLLLLGWLYNIIFRFFFILVAVTHRKEETLASSIRLVAAVLLTRFLFVYNLLLTCFDPCEQTKVICLNNHIRANWLLDLTSSILLFMLFFIQLL